LFQDMKGLPNNGPFLIGGDHQDLDTALPTLDFTTFLNNVNNLHCEHNQSRILGLYRKLVSQ